MRLSGLFGPSEIGFAFHGINLSGFFSLFGLFGLSGLFRLFRLSRLLNWLTSEQAGKRASYLLDSFWMFFKEFISQIWGSCILAFGGGTEANLSPG
jgi:hypothetical protein